MNDDERDEAIAARARARLDEASEELDAATRMRLRAARLRALDRLAEPASRARRRGLALAGAGLAAFALAAVVTWWPPGETDLQHALADGFEDVEILSAADDLELYDELDFYRWLAESEAI